MAKLTETQKNLLDAALQAMNRAYVLYSFPVGAAVMAEDGEIYEGCNIESWVSSLGTCAERAAINHAVLHGNLRIREVAVLLSDKHVGDALPCGACLQHISDFAENPQIKIVMAKADGSRVLFETVQVKTLAELLPFAYKK